MNMLQSKETSFWRSWNRLGSRTIRSFMICDKSMPEKLNIDLLSQAEHDEKANILITNDREYALEVEKEIENYLTKLKKRNCQI